ncbi:hypothetical protein [Erythrobacter aureus]|uniref:DUF2059 domain-containing protein n=1 Tax=Erythrobacter aureus TaxID=2182384 RepID=A0A345YCG1_9SPHN|nr:hypothetical protein [Erythrobacter aureus]AXK41613.1 hypothetical protein DVR09_04065 [Erythrobacter aureus]
MRKILLPALLAALATPAMAEAAGPTNAPLAALGEQMHDPERQRDMALMLRAMTEVLLDMPIGPLAEAAAEMAGEDVRPIDPDMTLRQMTPEADRIGDEVSRNVPRAMQAAGSMAEGLAAMTPLLREMAERFREAMPERD